ncbi:MAG: hypothetical protein QXF12_00600 [Candidatus Aenigmatarchaeota archaeon]
MKAVKNFEEKWGKSLTEKMISIKLSNRVDEFIDDLSNMPGFFDRNNKTTIIVRDERTAAKLALVLEDEVNIAFLGGYISSIENKGPNDLNHSYLEEYDGKVLLFFEDSPEADITQDFLQERYPNVVFIRAPYGISVKSPVATDRETINKVIREIKK